MSSALQSAAPPIAVEESEIALMLPPLMIIWHALVTELLLVQPMAVPCEIDVVAVSEPQLSSQQCAVLVFAFSQVNVSVPEPSLAMQLPFKLLLLMVLDVPSANVIVALLSPVMHIVEEALFEDGVLIFTPASVMSALEEAMEMVSDVSLTPSAFLITTGLSVLIVRTPVSAG